MNNITSLSVNSRNTSQYDNLPRIAFYGVWVPEMIEAMSQFYEHLKTVGRSLRTIENHKSHLQRLNTYLSAKCNRSIYVDEIKVDDLEKYLFAPPNDKAFTQASRYAKVTAFKSFLSFCYKNGYTQTNIGTKLPKIKEKSKERVSLTEDELFGILEFISSETDKALIQTLFYAGLRIGEAIQLTFEDINIDGNYLYIRKHKSQDNRKVPISVKLDSILYNYLENHRPETESENIFIFAQNYPTGIKSHVNARLKEAGQKAGFNIPITSHIMRHSFASNLLAKGVNIVQLQKLLGHRSLETTNIYLHAHIDALKNAVNTL